MCHYFAKVGKKNRRGFDLVFSLCQVSDPHSRPVGGDNESLNFFAKVQADPKEDEGEGLETLQSFLTVTNQPTAG